MNLKHLLIALSVVGLAATVSFASSTISITINEDTGKLGYSYQIENFGSGSGELSALPGKWDSLNNTESWNLSAMAGDNQIITKAAINQYQALIVTELGTNPADTSSMVSDLVTIDSGTRSGVGQGNQFITAYDRVVDPGETAVAAYGHAGGGSGPYVGDISTVAGLEANLLWNHPTNIGGFNFAVASENLMPDGTLSTGAVTGITLYHPDPNLNGPGQGGYRALETTITFEETPLPAAVWPGLGMLGALAAVGLLRRKLALR